MCTQVQRICHGVLHAIIVFFGVQKDNSDCDFSDNVNMTARNVISGDSTCFEVNDGILQRNFGEEYCYKGSLIGDTDIVDGNLVLRQL